MKLYQWKTPHKNGGIDKFIGYLIKNEINWCMKTNLQF